jgi:hypothetical protein
VNNRGEVDNDTARAIRSMREEDMPRCEEPAHYKAAVAAFNGMLSKFKGNGSPEAKQFNCSCDSRLAAPLGVTICFLARLRPAKSFNDLVKRSKTTGDVEVDDVKWAREQLVGEKD